MRTLGVLGGLGPDTTAKFYLEIIRELGELGAHQRPPILIWNTSLPIELERRFLLTGNGIGEYLPYLIEGAQRLQEGGAETIVIPCNSVHVFIEEIRNAVNIPVMSIIEETVAHIQENSIDNIGLLSTGVTSKNKLYESVFIQKDIQFFNTDPISQDTLNNVIFNVVSGECTNHDKEQVRAIAYGLYHNGAKNILLACTDLQLIYPHHCNNLFPILDTMSILARSSVNFLTKPKENEDISAWY